MTSTEKEDLENLLRHPGWLYVKQHAEKAWTTGIADHMRNAVSDTNDAAALAKMRQIIVAKDAVQSILDWPQQRVNQLTAKTELDGMADGAIALASRGGYSRA